MGKYFVHAAPVDRISHRLWRTNRMCFCVLQRASSVQTFMWAAQRRRSPLGPVLKPLEAAEKIPIDFTWLCIRPLMHGRIGYPLPSVALQTEGGNNTHSRRRAHCPFPAALRASTQPPAAFFLNIEGCLPALLLLGQLLLLSCAQLRQRVGNADCLEEEQLI